MNLENFRNRLSSINERFLDQNNYHKKINDDMLYPLENVSQAKEDLKQTDSIGGLVKDIDTLISSIEKQLDFQGSNLTKTQELVRYPQDTCIQAR